MVKKIRKKRKGVVSAYNRHVGREMRAGKTMKQAAASWKGKGSKAPRRRASKPKRRRTTSKRRTRKVTKRGGFNSQKIMKLVRIVGLLGPAVGAVMATGHSPQWKVEEIVRMYSGYHPSTKQFKFEWLAEGWTPYLGTVLATYGIPKIAGMIRGL